MAPPSVTSGGNLISAGVLQVTGMEPDQGVKMKLGFEEFGGVKYWLSATQDGDKPWCGEANVRIKDGNDYGQKTIIAPDTFRSGEEAMDGARQMLQALCLSGALRNILPHAYEVIETENTSKAPF